MTIIKLCDYYIITNYKKSDAKEKLEERIIDFLDNLDRDVPFDLSDFVDELTEDERDFELMTNTNDEDPDIEYNAEEMDDFIDNLLTTEVDSEEVYFYGETDDQGE